MSSQCLVEMHGISKRFPGVKANDSVDLRLFAGEIHCLLGENGSGKSTLMTILSGLYKPDAGQLFIHGAPVTFHSPRDAIKAGIGMVHQHFKLVETFTVAQNIVLGDRKLSFVPNMDQVESALADLSRQYKLAIDPKARVWQLSVGERQRVEIVKMLYRGCETLILDEPTAVLTPQETRELFSILREMADEGKAIVVITHKLREVMEIADRVTVLRKGLKVAEYTRGNFSEAQLARAMVGKEIISRIRRQPASVGEEVLRLEDVSAFNDSGGRLESVSLSVREGEIFGIAGVAGNGQRELAEVISGLRRISQGSIYINGVDMTSSSIRQRISAGISYVPEDRLGTGLVPGLGIVENVILKGYHTSAYSIGPFLKRREALSKSMELVSKFNIFTSSLESPVSMLSGGNLQKLLLAREFSSDPKLIVAVYPVRGLDIGATDAVHRLIIEEKEKGAAVLLISEDLDEVLKLSDRIGVLYEGRLAGPVNREDTDIEELGLMMMGASGEVASGGIRSC